ncbi:hypothetical protein JTB14_026167 [Gonioctena quinquepunctata]|nr:hypothetical protein JTB14_026167 [Gonioctena quinquepunctata]
MDSITISKEPSTSCAPPPVVMSGVMCSMCSKTFASIKLLNRHKKRIHQIDTVSAPRQSRIICPLCEERHELKTHEVLRKHLEVKHAVNIELLTLQFSSIPAYESWKKEENIDTSYAIQRTNLKNDHKEVNYICNRSDYKGPRRIQPAVLTGPTREAWYQANYQRRTEKWGGTIRIQGMCPSKLTCKLYDNGIVSMAFWKTHVGHARELRSLHLSKAEQDTVVNKIKSGVSIDGILEDARNLKGPELQRINLINRDDIVYLTRKHNIDKKRDHIKSQNEEEKRTQQIENLEVQDEREAKWTNFKNWAEALNDEVFNRFMDNIQGAIGEADQARPTDKIPQFARANSRNILIQANQNMIPG